MTDYDVVVVGAGPAGQAAASETTRAGARVALVDEHPRVSAEAASVLAGYSVWDVWGERTKSLSLYSPTDGLRQLQTRILILAPGERARTVPFPGWTLPGVVNLNESTPMVARGQRVALAGTGPILLQRARQLLARRTDLAVVADTRAPSSLASLIGFALLGMGSSLAELVATWVALRARRVPWLSSHGVAEALGGSRVKSVTMRSLRIHRSTVCFDVDALCLEFGRVPATEIPFGIGADWRFEERIGTFVARRDARLRLTVPGVFLAGTAGGVARGSAWAEAEGRLAGIWAAVDMGLLTESAGTARALTAYRAIRRGRRLAALVAGPQPVLPGQPSWATPETILCRCEGVTLGDLKRSLLADVSDPNWVKGPTGAAMGRCLGRDCETPIALAVAPLGGDSAAGGRPLNVRPPFRPVPLGVLASQTAPPERIQLIAGA